MRGNVREPDQLVGDIYALATCNEVGHRRLVDMMDEFALDDLGHLRLHPRELPRATHRSGSALPKGNRGRAR
jgi:N-methylhydantoinase B